MRIVRAPGLPLKGTPAYDDVTTMMDGQSIELDSLGWMFKRFSKRLQHGKRNIARSCRWRACRILLSGGIVILPKNFGDELRRRVPLEK